MTQLNSHRGAVCVVGCMRNGTSLVSQLIGQTMVHFGSSEDLINRGTRDPNGIWEHQEFQNLNKQILRINDGDFVHLKRIRNFVALDWKDQRLIDSHKSEIPNTWQLLKGLSVQNSRLLDPRPWVGWKDPRNSLTLPYWHMALTTGIVQRDIPNNHRIKRVIWSIRHPQEAARSMASLGYGKIKNYHYFFHLWHLYNQAIMDFVLKREIPFLIVKHRELFITPTKETSRIIKFLDVGDKQEASYQEKMLSIIDPSLYRYKNDVYDDQSALFDKIIKLREAQ